ncbi:MAG: NAD-dependent epimerase/dehydratase family protein, partial [Nakamurella sp.]
GVQATDAPDYVSHNVAGTASVLSAMARRGVHRLVLAASMVVYGEGGYRCVLDGAVRPGARSAADLANGRFDPPCPECGRALDWATVDESAATDPRNTYAATKLAQENLASAWAQQVSGSVTTLRYHNVYGPRMPRDTPYAGVASIFRSAIEAGNAPQVYEDGRQRRDFVHVGDVARANVLALSRSYARSAEDSPESLVCNISSGIPHTVGELANALALELDGPPPEVVGGGRPGDVRHVVADPARAREVLGFAARTSFAAGVAEFARAPMRAPVGV